MSRGIRRWARLAAALLALTALSACTAAPAPPADPALTVRPGGPDGRPATEPPTPAELSEADLDFLAHMIAHHEQAVELAGLAPDRAADEELRALAARILVAQEAEIAQMRAWLDRRRLPERSHAHDTLDMPGALSAAELDGVREAHGAEFDARFAALMIRHHEGAIEMAAERLATTGDSSVARLAGSMADAQRLEIERLRPFVE